MRYHLTPVRLATIKQANQQKLENKKCGKDVEKLELSYTVGGNRKLCSPHGRQDGFSSQNEEVNYYMSQPFNFQIFIQKI